MARGKPAWSQVNLRCIDDDLPEVGDELRTPSGRRYQVLGLRGHQMTCLVLPPEAPVQGRVLAWFWAGRRRAC
jgi:hypothetical protein